MLSVCFMERFYLLILCSFCCFLCKTSPYQGEGSRMELSVVGGDTVSESCRCRVSWEGSLSQNWWKRNTKKPLKTLRLVSGIKTDIVSTSNTPSSLFLDTKYHSDLPEKKHCMFISLRESLLLDTDYINNYNVLIGPLVLTMVNFILEQVCQFCSVPPWSLICFL